MPDGSPWTIGIAALGLGLSMFNLVRSVCANRPVVFLAPHVLGGTTDIRLNIVNMTNRPLLLRRVHAYPKHICAYGQEENRFDPTAFKPGVLGSITRRYTQLLAANESTHLGFRGLKRGDWCLLIVKWSQGFTILPWSIVWARHSVIRDLYTSADPPI
jgi:hypothetical protein